MVAHRLQHWASIGLPVEWPYHDICSHNASLMLAHHLQPCLNSKTALAKHLFFAGALFGMKFAGGYNCTIFVFKITAIRHSQ